MIKTKHVDEFAMFMRRDHFIVRTESIAAIRRKTALTSSGRVWTSARNFERKPEEPRERSIEPGISRKTVVTNFVISINSLASWSKLRYQPFSSCST